MIKDSFVEIEKAQQTLRQSIEASKDLAAQSELLISPRRKELREGRAGGSAGLPTDG